jgi:hypothetical protein
MALKSILGSLRQSAASLAARAGGPPKNSAWAEGWLSDWRHAGRAADSGLKADAAAGKELADEQASGEAAGQAALAAAAPGAVPAAGKAAQALSDGTVSPGSRAASGTARASLTGNSAAAGRATERLSQPVNLNKSLPGQAAAPPQIQRPLNGRPVNGRPVNLEAAFAPQLERDLSKEKIMAGDGNTGGAAPAAATPPDTSALNKQIVQAVNFTNYQNLANAPAMVITPPEMSVGQTTAIAVQDAESYMNAIMQIAVAGQAVAIKKAAQGPAGELIAVPLMAEIQAMVQAAVGVYGTVSTTAGTSASTVIGDLKTAVS